MPPLDLSIIMPVRNAEPFVAAALASVLRQEGVELEVIVIDDGSTDRSAEAVRAAGDPRVRLIEGPGRGIAAAFNAALEACRSRFVARCDSDDLLPAGRLARQLQWLRGKPEFAAICGGFATMTGRGRLVADLGCGTAAEEITGELLDGSVRTSYCTYLSRTDRLRAVGGCREFFAIAEDIDLQLRLAEAGRIWFDPRRAYLYRLHDRSITHTRGTILREFYDDAARRFQQQRRAGGRDDLQRHDPPLPPADDPATRRGCRAQIQGNLLGAAWARHEGGQRLPALATAVRACLARPGNLRAWKSLGALALRSQER